MTVAVLVADVVAVAVAVADEVAVFVADVVAVFVAVAEGVAVLVVDLVAVSVAVADTVTVVVTVTVTVVVVVAVPEEVGDTLGLAILMREEPTGTRMAPSDVTACEPCMVPPPLMLHCTAPAAAVSPNNMPLRSPNTTTPTLVTTAVE